MKYALRRALVVLGATLALGAVLSASASATILYPELVNRKEETLSKKGFTSSSVAVELQSTRSKEDTVKCTGSAMKGEVTGLRTSKLSITLTGCKGELLGKCTSAGQAEGTIVSHALVAELVWLKASTELIGWRLQPETNNGPFAQYSCVKGLLNYTVGVHEAEKGGLDALLGEFPSGDYTKLTKELGQVYGCTSATQKWTSWYNPEGTGKFISAYLETELMSKEFKQWSQSCLGAPESKLKFEEEVELKR